MCMLMANISNTELSFKRRCIGGLGTSRRVRMRNIYQLLEEEGGLIRFPGKCCYLQSSSSCISHILGQRCIFMVSVIVNLVKWIVRCVQNIYIVQLMYTWFMRLK